MKSIKRNSIMVRVATLLLIVIFAQAAVFLGMTLFTNIVPDVERLTTESFIQSAEDRKKYIESIMVDRWSNVELFEQEITESYNTLLRANEGLDGEQKQEFMEASMPVLIEMIESSATTGGFIILDDATEDSDEYTAIRIQVKDESKMVSSENTLQLVNGDSSLAWAHQMEITNSWNEKIQLEDTTNTFFSSTLESINETGAHKTEGYWMVVPDREDEGSGILVYAYPLLDQDGKSIGVLGAEIHQDYLFELLPYGGFGEEKTIAYMLATIDINEQTKEEVIEPILVQKEVQRTAFPVREPIDASECELAGVAGTQGCLYSVNSQGNDLVTYTNKLQLYDTTPIYGKDNLFFVAVTGERNITQFSDEIRETLIITIVTSILIGIVMALIAGYRFATPISRLNNMVKAKKKETSIKLEKIGISEIDELSQAVEKLSESMIASSHKTDKIFDMLQLGVGSFEYVVGAEMVTISSSLRRILRIEGEGIGEFEVSEELFFKQLDEMMRELEEDMEETYKSPFEEEKWYQIQELIQDNSRLGIVMDVTKEVYEKRALNYERDYDMLTGIYNRLAFRRKANAIFMKGNLNNAAFIMFDLDNLKYVNDTFGHDMGDVYIKTAASIIQETFDNNAVVGRMSGDEFYVFMHHFEEKEDIQKYTDKLYKTLEERPIVLSDESEFRIRMSGGIAWYGIDSTNLDELIKFSDFAMYTGKHTLKGELRQFSRSVYQAESFMLSGKEELNRVLDNEFIDFVFQPIVSARTGEIYAYEALMRPDSKTLDNPLKLLQIATAQSKLWKIEKITFFKSISLFEKHKELFGKAKLFINSVPNQTLKEEEFEELELLYKERLKDVVVEIIESEQLEEEKYQYKLEKISSWGSMIALDDYGSGYNSDLGLLKISPDIVKIDRSLLTNIHVDVARQSIVSKIMAFCKQQGILILAEGVETKQEMEYLLKVDVDLLQGYYISKPKPLPDFDSTIIAGEISRVRENRH